jgi:hypothetical protein
MFPLAQLEELSVAKHTGLRVAINGTVESLQAVTKKLLFLYIRCDASGHLRECIAKLADGFLCLPAIAGLAAAVAPGGRRCSLLSFPERAENGTITLHVVNIRLPAARNFPALRLPRTKAAPGAVVERAARTRLSSGGWTSSGNRVRPANANRFMVLAQWLADTFGREALVRGGGVLDVAGGAGGMAFELSCRRGVPCTVVDPRPVICTKKQRVALTNTVAVATLRRENQAMALQPPVAASQNEMPAQPQLEPELKVRRVFVAIARSIDDSERWTFGVSWAAMSDEATAPIGAGRAAAYDWAVDVCKYVSTSANRPIVLPSQLVGSFEDNFADDSSTAGLWSASSVIVGLHSDGATEPIVKLALEHGKPFAVVPCCVFPNTNQHRRLTLAQSKQRGSRKGQYDTVRTYEEFVVWLQELAPQRIKKAELAFEGRNQVLYCLGDS